MSSLKMDPNNPHPPMSDQSLAAVQQIAHTGAKSFQIRYSDDEPPVVWVAIAEYELDEQIFYKLGASLDPDKAILALLDEVIDGGVCVHCGKPAGVESDLGELNMPLSSIICWYQYDPELKKYRRSCEGET